MTGGSLFVPNEYGSLAVTIGAVEKANAKPMKFAINKVSGNMVIRRSAY